MREQNTRDHDLDASGERAQPPPVAPVGRRRRAITIALVTTMVAIVAVGLLAYADRASHDTTSQSAPMSDAAQGAGAEGAQLQARLQRAGVPMSSMSSTKMHIHPVLRVFVAGNRVLVPEAVGITSDLGMAALHTHDSSGKIHVESPVVRDYTLGQFFDVWGVRLTRRCLGKTCTGPDTELRAFVDDVAIATAPREIKLEDQQQILLVLGTRDQIRDARRR